VYNTYSATTNKSKRYPLASCFTPTVMIYDSPYAAKQCHERTHLQCSRSPPAQA
jgi:hypothetical protein